MFYLESRAFLHFHDDPAGIFADVRLADEFVRVPVTSAAGQADLLGRIEDCLATIEKRSAGKRVRARPASGRRSRPRDVLG